MEYGSFKQTFIEGAVVFSIEKTDYSASNYFEKTFPKAKEFYTRIATDREYAKSVWEGLKATTDVDQFTNYYKNVSLDEFINDFKELFSSNSSVPNLNYGLEVKEDTAKVIAPKDSQEEQIIIEDILKNRNEIKEVEVQGTTYNIKSLSNLQIRNALDFIPKVSFLLSNILIKVGEYLDLGEKGIYKIKSGDTLSTIAQRNG
ncbi:LysM domain-containing protein, partial [Campylobacter ureolyticus]|uniref:LysM domain-containing protein n=1 Tax=Campylobacter ureolyticus TaxID=827 RepID=UPI002911A403